MWQRFTERARRVILLAQEEAGQMSAGHVGTEHLLLGLLREDEGVAAQVLNKMGVELADVRAAVVAEVESGDLPSLPEPRLSPKAKRVLELAADEGRRMKHNYIGTEHLLLGVLRQKDGMGAKILRGLGLDLEMARSYVLEYLGVGPTTAAPPAVTTPEVDPVGASPEADAEAAQFRSLFSATAGVDEPKAVPASGAQRQQNEDAILAGVLRQMQANDERQRVYDEMLMRLLWRLLTRSGVATTLLAECGLDIEAAKARVQKFLDENS